jgi:hypothetical protein
VANAGRERAEIVVAADDDPVDERGGRVAHRPGAERAADEQVDPARRRTFVDDIRAHTPV